MNCVKCIFCGRLPKFFVASQCWCCDTHSCLVRGPNDDKDGTKWNTMMTTVESYRFTAPTRITPQVAKDLPFDLPPARQTTVYVDDEGVEHYTFASAMRENARHWLRQLLEDAGIRDADDRSSVVDTLFNEADDISLTLKMIYDLPAEDTHD